MERSKVSSAVTCIPICRVQADGPLTHRRAPGGWDVVHFEITGSEDQGRDRVRAKFETPQWPSAASAFDPSQQEQAGLARLRDGRRWDDRAADSLLEQPNL